VEGLFATVKALAEGGVTVVFITHKIREILANCDRVTVMRGGRVVATVERTSASETELIEMMVGERGMALDAGMGRSAGPQGTPALEIHGLSVTDASGLIVVEPCSLSVRAGEIVGVAGAA